MNPKQEKNEENKKKPSAFNLLMQLGTLNKYKDFYSNDEYVYLMSSFRHDLKFL